MKEQMVMNEPILENPHVRELLAILDANRVEAADLRAMLGYVHAMERQLDGAVAE
jgi:hypothetical protein